jgi:hypothetical protein
MSLGVTEAQSILRETYPNGIVEIDYKKAKTLALLRKEKGTLVEAPFGYGFKIPIKYSNPQAGSATYATGYAQASTEKTRYTNWFLTPGELFQFARVSGSLIRRSQGVGSFVKAIVSEIENTKTAMTRMCEMYLDGDGYGALGQIGSISTSTVSTVTLAYPWQARFFEIGMSVVAADSNAASALKYPTAGKAAKITARDTGAGTLTFDSDMTTTAGTAWAADDYLFRYGDHEDDSTPERLIPCGFAGFIPDTAALRSTSFFNVDQTLTERLGGLRRTGSQSGSLEEALLDMSADIDAAGGTTTHCVLGSSTHAKLAKTLLNKVYMDMEDMDGVKLGFKGIVIQGASGDFLVYSDSAFAEGRARLFDVEDIGIQHTGDDLCFIDQTDGLMVREIAGSDDWGARVVSSWQFHVDAPGHAGVVTGL